MALVNWDSSLSVNVSEVDNQHKKLIQLINDLNDAMKSGKSKEVVVTTINGLANYTATHFRFEEQQFEKFGYAHTAAHKALHAEFERRVQNFKTDIQNGKLGTSIEVLNFLVSWLKNHIMIEDRKYTELFNKNGLL